MDSDGAASSAQSSTGAFPVTVSVESRDAYAFSACVAYLGHLDAAAPLLGVAVMWPRDPDSKVLCVPAQGALRSVAFGENVVQYSVACVGDPVASDSKAERFKELRLHGPTRDVLVEFVKVALAFYRRECAERGVARDGVVVYAWDDGAWTRVRVRPGRALGTLYFPDNQHSELRDSVRSFYAQTSRLTGLHVSTVRTYLLHGTPGSGKTSLVHCLASEMGYGLATLAFGPGMTDVDVAAALNRVPPRCLVLVEDIDCAFSGRSATEHGVTFSSLLSALDGAWTEQPQAIFLTTNHAAQLDAALRRRVDYVMRFGPATRTQVERIVGVFFAQPRAEDVEKVWEACKGASMSVVQKYLVKVMDAESCASRLDVLRELVECADPAFGVSTNLPGMYA